MFNKKNTEYNYGTTTATNNEKTKKPFYKRIWVWLIIALLVIGAFGGGNTSKSQNSSSDETVVQSEEAETTVQSEEEEMTESEEMSPEENANKMGMWWFTHIDWDSVFKYNNKIHSFTGYVCKPVTSEELVEYGSYVVIAPADLQNEFGAEFNSNVYIFMDENGIATHIFYEEADGSLCEVDFENVRVYSKSLPKKFFE